MVEDFTPFFNMYVYIMQEQTIQQTFDVIASDSTTDIRFPSDDYRKKIGGIIKNINKPTTSNIDEDYDDPNSRDYDIAKLILMMNKVMNWEYKVMIYNQQRRKYKKTTFFKGRPPIKPEFNEKDEFNNGELDEVKTEFIDIKENDDDKKAKLDRFITKIAKVIYYYENLALPNGHNASDGSKYLAHRGGTRRRRKGQRTRKRGTRKAKKTRRTIRTRRARKTKKR